MTRHLTTGVYMLTALTGGITPDLTTLVSVAAIPRIDLVLYALLASR